MKRFVSALSALAVFVALVIVTTTSADAQSCSNATLTGNYGVTFSGFVAPGHSTRGHEVPAAGAGLGTFDGAGNFSMTYNNSINGRIFPNNLYTATYTVNSDCTGSMTSTNGGPNLSFVIVSGGAEALFIDIDPGNTWTADAKKQ